MAVGDSSRSKCAKCGGDVEFKTIAFGSSTETNDTEDIFVWTTWSLDVCLHSGHVRFRRSKACSEEYDDDGSIAEDVEEMYPDDVRVWPNDLVQSLSEELQEFYFETLVAYHAKSFVLTAAGVRAIVERACVEIGIEGVEKIKKTGGKYLKSDLEGKIEELQNQGILVRESSAIDQIRLLGNEGVHQLARPTMEELDNALDIVEHMLSELFLRPKRADEIAKKGAKIEDARLKRKKH